MKSNKYWEDRANLRMSTYHKNSDETIGKINNAYDKAIKDINQDMETIFYNYYKQHGLDSKKAAKLLNSRIDSNILNKVYKKLLNKTDDEKIKAWLLSRLNRNAYKARITRLEAIKDSIYTNIKCVADTEVSQNTWGYVNTINNAYYKTIYDIQKGVGLGFDFAPMSVNKVEEILKNNWSGKHYSERVWGNTEVLASKLEETITSGLMNGKSSRRMVKELEELGNYGKMSSERLVRTETTYIANEAELESYKECGIDKYVFVATLDLRTSSMCREMDGKIIEVSKGIAGENLPPLHPWCRSTTIAYMGKEWYKNIRRRARDPETGKTYTVPGNMKYDEWYKSNVVSKYGEQKAETFQKMIRNKASDIKQYEKFKEILGKDVPKSFTDFRDLKYNDSDGWKNLKHNYKQSGGKYTRGDIAWNDRRDNESEDYYHSIRKREDDILKISQNTNWSEKSITQIKNHIFNDKHILRNGETGLLDTDYDMAVAWQRLINGKYEQRDILLLKHEYIESINEKKDRLTNLQAHRIAEEKHNWNEKLIKEKGEYGEDDCLNELIRDE